MIAPLRILMICPAPPGSRKGNRVTALRWARLLHGLGHRVRIVQDYERGDWDLLVALHARRSARAVRRFRRLQPHRPIVLALTGTDLYRDIRTSATARRSVELATRLVVLQARGLDELGPQERAKAHVILQSAQPTPGRRGRPRAGPGARFQVCVLGHLRREKDPLRTALAVRMLPASSGVRVTHAGAAIDPVLGDRARAEMQRNPRYQWLGELSAARARQLLASSDLMVLSSRMEGGANVLSETLVDRVPVVASDIPSAVAILGADYPGLYRVGDTRALARLIRRAETDARFRARLQRRCARLARRFTPEREAAAWSRLLDEIGADRTPSSEKRGTRWRSNAKSAECLVPRQR